MPLLGEAIAGFADCENPERTRYYASLLKNKAAELAANPQLARITGLTSRPELNGRSAEVLSFLLEKGRFAVRVKPGGGHADWHGMNLKPENLEPETESTAEAAASRAEPEAEATLTVGMRTIECCFQRVGFSCSVLTIECLKAIDGCDIIARTVTTTKDKTMS